MVFGWIGFRWDSGFCGNNGWLQFEHQGSGSGEDQNAGG
jgi:hypothetical protein